MRRWSIGSRVSLMVVAACGGGGPEPSGPAKASLHPVASASVAPLASASATPSVSASSNASQPPARVAFTDAVPRFLKANRAAFHAHDAKRIAELYARDAVIASPSARGLEETDPSSMRRDLEALYLAFPDADLSVSRVLATGNVALMEWVITGTNKGDFMGLGVTGKTIGYRGVSVLMFDDFGQVSHETMYFDLGTVMGQLGLGPKGLKVRPADVASPVEPEIIFGDDPSTVDNVAALKDLYAALDRHDEKAVLAKTSDQLLFSAAPRSTDLKRTDYVKSIRDEALGFSDCKTETVACWSIGPWAACETLWTATMKGEALGMRPNHQKGSVHGIDLVKLESGKIARIESFSNGAETTASFGGTGDKPKPANDEVKLTGSKPSAAKKPPPKN